jgi:hypothetical protein
VNLGHILASIGAHPRLDRRERLTTRAQTDEFVESLYKPEIDFAVVDRAAEVAAARGLPARRSHWRGS